jgi:hypothetical protein
METTQTVTVVEQTSATLPETKIELEPLAPTPTAEEKKVSVGVLAAAGGIVGCCMLSLLLFALAIPILKIIMGRHYKDQCPIQPKIPFFLLVGGIVGIIATLVPILGIGISFIQAKKLIEKEEEAADESAASKAFTLAGIIGIVTIILNVFLFIWLILGAVWTFRVYNTVSYDATNQKNYCHSTLYKFTVFILIFSFLQAIGQCCCGGHRTRQGK